MSAKTGDEKEAEDTKVSRRERAVAEAGNDLVNRQAAALAVVPLGARATATDATDEERGYATRRLANGQTDYMALHDQWTNPDEAVVRAHVADYRARRDGTVSG